MVLESTLLRAVDNSAKRVGVSRSALIRDALREHVKRLRIAEMEKREGEAYLRQPDDGLEAARWAQVAAWPED